MNRTIVLADTPAAFWQRTMLMRSLDGMGKVSFLAFENMLEDYYKNNGLYDAIQQALYDQSIWTPGMKPLRNPANRAVEFHVGHLWSGPLQKAFPILTKNTKLSDLIMKIWDWSNWQTKKQLAARWYANLGTMYIKVYTISERVTAETKEPPKVKRVVQKVIKPQNVTDFRTDERDFIVFVRLDSSVEGEDEQGNPALRTRTEVWDKDQNRYRVFVHDKGRDDDISKLGTPQVDRPITDFGIDFIPIVHAKFIDIGEKRGMGVFTHALDKIDEANRQATRLHQILFRYNKPTIAVRANATDPQGRPLPAPVLESSGGTRAEGGVPLAEKDEDMISLPGTAEADMLVPDIRYDAALNILNAQMTELEEDLPEIMYYRLKDKGDISGRALRTMLSGAVDRALDARTNAEAAMIRANQMALTIGQANRLEGFEEIGTFEGGDFEHSFAARDVIPPDAKERADTYKVYRDAGVGHGPAGRLAGLSEDQIKDIEKTAAEERQAQSEELGQMLLEAERRRDQNLTQ